MTCLIRKTCNYDSGNCNQDTCGYFSTQYAEYVEIPKGFLPKKEDRRKEKLSKILLQEWEEGWG